ncbi:30S ribosomal protein S20 [Desulfothermus okinawensis JCM 13304]
MANTKQALKRHRQSLKRRARNRAIKSRMKKAIKRVRLALEAKDKDMAQAALKNATSILDKAASKGVIHWKNAARRISRLSAQVSKLN